MSHYKNWVRAFVALVASLALVGGFPLPTLATQSVAEAPNSYAVAVYDCNPPWGRVMVKATVINTVDSGGAAFKLSRIVAVRSDEFYNSAYGLPVSILDGESFTIPVGHDGSGTADGEYGLYPGEWAISFYTGDGFGTPLATRHISVPACGNQVPPPPPDGPGGPEVSQPRGTIKLSCRSGTATAQLVNRGVPRRTTFTVLVDPRKGRTITKRYTVAPGQIARHTVRKVKPGSKVLIKVGRKQLTKPKRC